jgi:hypothetical protein
LKFYVLSSAHGSLLIARHGGDFDLEVLHTNECAEKILGFWDGVVKSEFSSTNYGILNHSYLVTRCQRRYSEMIIQKHIWHTTN